MRVCAALLHQGTGAPVAAMKNDEKPSDADLVAEMNHFRSEAIKQELASGEQAPLTQDKATAGLPRGIQRTRPAFPRDAAVD